jgi:hypothetical protein
MGKSDTSKIHENYLAHSSPSLHRMHNRRPDRRRLDVLCNSPKDPPASISLDLVYVTIMGRSTYTCILSAQWDILSRNLYGGPHEYFRNANCVVRLFVISSIVRTPMLQNANRMTSIFQEAGNLPDHDLSPQVHPGDL